MAESVLEVVGKLQSRLSGSSEPKKVKGAPGGRRGRSGAALAGGRGLAQGGMAIRMAPRGGGGLRWGSELWMRVVNGEGAGLEPLRGALPEMLRAGGGGAEAA